METIQEEKPYAGGFTREQLKDMVINILKDRTSETAYMPAVQMVHAAGGWLRVAECRILSKPEIRLEIASIVQKLELLEKRLLHIAERLETEAKELKRVHCPRYCGKYARKVKEIINVNVVKVEIRDIVDNIMYIFRRGPQHERVWDTYMALAIYALIHVDEDIDYIVRELDQIETKLAEKGGRENMSKLHFIISNIIWKLTHKIIY